MKISIRQEKGISLYHRLMDSKKDFYLRRLHSLSGLALILFLLEHLFTNSQAALTENGNGYIHSVNAIYAIPYLRVVELTLIALPFLLHGLWGIFYAREASPNSFSSDGSRASLPEYRRNRAFTWQRVTAYLILLGVTLHVVQMRFIHYPEEVPAGFSVDLQLDAGTKTFAERLEATIDQQTGVVTTSTFGAASLLALRNVLKNPLMMALYALFVATTCYHAFNGLWTASITWGLNISVAAQQRFLTFSWVLMLFTLFLGLAAALLTYWNLS